MTTMVRALPPVDISTELNRANMAAGQSPGGSAAPPINLLTSITNGVTSGAIPDRWQAGVCHVPTGCNCHELFVHECDPLLAELPRPTVKTIHEQTCEVEAWPFDIPHGVRLECGSAAEAETQARAELEALTPVAMAQYLHEKVRSLAEGLPGDQAVPMATGIGMLFEARSATGPGGGVLHIPDRAVGVAVSSQLIVRGGARYTSVYGSPVIVGPGFPSKGPDASAATNPADEPGTAWLYITSNVDYALSPIERLDSSTSLAQAAQNRIYSALVERRALVRLDDCHVYAVRVNLC